jgi:hypothetical protein
LSDRELGEERQGVVLGLELVVAGAEGHRAEAVVGERLALDLDDPAVKEHPAGPVVAQPAARLEVQRELAGQPDVILAVGRVVRGGS